MPTLERNPTGSPNNNPATIVVGPVEPNDMGGKFINTENGIWDDYMIVSRYEQDQHLYMMGVTSPSGFQSSTGSAKVALAQLAYPTLLWIVDWTAQRRDEKPTIPPPFIVGEPNWVLMDEFIEPGMIVVPADGSTPIFRISGTQVFCNTKPDPILIRNARFTKPPWLDTSTFDRSVPEALWENGLTR